MANLDSWQKFNKIWNVLYVNQMEKRMNTNELMTLPTYLGIDKSEYYKKLGISSEEQQARHAQARSEIMSYHVNNGLLYSHVFEIDKIEKRLMLLTDAPKDKRILRKLKLPFASVFLDVDIKKSEIDYSVDFDEINGIMIAKHTGLDEADNPTGSQYLYVAYAGTVTNKEGQKIAMVEDLIFPLDESMKVMWHSKKDYSFVQDFIINFLMFILHPEVEYVNVKRGDKNRARRVAQGKDILPDSQKIRLSGNIKRYLGKSYGNSLENDFFSHRFWVRGHWRVFRSERYTNMKGRVAWIEPFLKGIGELRTKVYSVEANKDDIREYKGKFLFLDDIEPLDAPLREMKQKEYLKRVKNGETQ